MNLKNIQTKYRNKPKEYMGIMFQSSKEAQYAQELELRKKERRDSERVMTYERQVRYPIVIKKQKICDYVADFVIHYSTGKTEVVDVKSPFTSKLPVYRLKKKLMLAVLGIEVIER